MKLRERLMCRVADRLDTITGVRHGSWRSLLGLPRVPQSPGWDATRR